MGIRAAARTTPPNPEHVLSLRRSPPTPRHHPPTTGCPIFGAHLAPKVGSSVNRQGALRKTNRMTHSGNVLTSTRMPPTTNHDKNKLYYGDNLEVLRDYIPDQSVDLIYLDPPFNSRQDYNVLFAEKDGTRSSSQIMAFEDTGSARVRRTLLSAAFDLDFDFERGGRVSDAMR